MQSNNKNITVGDILDLVENAIMPHNILIDKGPDKENISILSPGFCEDYEQYILTGIFVSEDGNLILTIG